ncbi:FAD binding domain-containing protein [Paramyrothecium foliicola]|nr:FAD binding domain-containing protein [Paramyrothecium foliicola]
MSSRPDLSLGMIEKARLKLNVLVVGAGLGGLATAVALARRGHEVTVLEQTSQLAEVGAGIQIPPNSAKLLQRWGVIQELDGKAVVPDGIFFRRWENGQCIGFTDLGDNFVKACGAPYYVVHRAHLHSALVRSAQKLGVTLLLDSRVASYDPSRPLLTLADGQTFEGDLIVAADGIKSVARSYVSRGHKSQPTPTGYAAYRATVDVRKMKQIPEVSWLLEKPGLNIWIGKDRHVMTYTIAAGESFNMVLSHKDGRDPSAWPKMTQDEILSEMRQHFHDWDPNLVKIIRLIDHTLKWSLVGNNTLDSWISTSSRLLVIGDASHAMVPYMSQGAAMAVEDGAALAVALNSIRGVAEIQSALELFQSERKKRTGMMQEASMVNAMIWHFPDGPVQRARDAAMRSEVEGRNIHNSPNQWSDPVTQSWAYGYDAERVMRQRWKESISELVVKGGKQHSSL